MRFFLCTIFFLSSCQSAMTDTKDIGLAASLGTNSDGRFVSNFGFFGMPSAEGKFNWYLQGPFYPILVAVVELLFNYDDFTDNDQYRNDDIHLGEPNSHFVPMTVSVGRTYGMTEELSLYAGVGMGFLYEYGARALPGASGYVEDYGTLGKGKFNLTGGMLYQMWESAGVYFNFDSGHQVWTLGLFLY